MFFLKKPSLGFSSKHSLSLRSWGQAVEGLYPSFIQTIGTCIVTSLAFRSKIFIIPLNKENNKDLILFG